ncbi:MAG: DUF3052 domain-containing protein [Kineosporiaceae bacterium]
MSATAEAGTSSSGPLGVVVSQVVQEFGWDDDVDEELRAAIEAITGGEIEDESSDEVADVVLVWFREDDGDLADALVDALTNLGDGGVVWLLTPKSGRDGHVEPSDIEEAAFTAGLHATSSISACRDWSGTRLTSKGRR